MIVMKFGGSSVATGERVQKVIEIVRANLVKKPALVLSAMGDTTDYLLEAAEKALVAGPVTVEKSLEKITAVHLDAFRALDLGKNFDDELGGLLADLGALLAGISLIKELSPRSKDFLVSFGERLSVRITAAAFNKAGIPACFLDAWDAGIVSSSNANAAEILDESAVLTAERVLPLVKKGIIPIITGFIAKDTGGIITTLGRGGSDLSATFIAAACGADEVQVWKDVDGLLSADPRLVPAARLVPEVSYEEAAELAYFGAQVLHPRAMQPCIKNKIPVLVKNSYNPAAEGTRIIAKTARRHLPVCSITARKNITLVDIVSSRMLGQSGFLAELFAVFAKYGISVDMLATSEVSVSLTLDSSFHLENAKKEIERIADIVVKTEKAIVTVICDITKSSSILEKAAGVCAKNNIDIQMVSQGASKVNISFVVNNSEADSVIQNLHNEFFSGVFPLP
ncbi:MAG: aspartate kinase [Spirochaetaceae bacterium]|jgi:aspartate kinase|nr:aspartate kinase [Spirochaetaceae bacterium]